MLDAKAKNPCRPRLARVSNLGWLMGLEPTTTGITIRVPESIATRLAARLVGNFAGIRL